eukprot:CAMPEP_0114978772 /NCGR_PEP_ID=MMETSP0216-20121206/4000_1 /TAXON_ID=223996 /ORGANISM="Protocruzia adherens, Strain Boccale" /LENGTH=420 /DNA_ID=CAMNT_0002340021 /DNA_START=337 /DNA_END=1596 /DNA_ORIENTATION=+
MEPVNVIRWISSLGAYLNCSRLTQFSMYYRWRLACAPHNIALFKTSYVDYYTRDPLLKVNREFACSNSQIYTRLNQTAQTFGNKLKTAQVLTRYRKFYDRVGLGEQCFSEFDALPRSFALNNPVDCEEFFSSVYPKAMESDHVEYLVKFPLRHQGKGVFALTKSFNSTTFLSYKYGQKCNVAPTLRQVLIQQYIPNPFLLDGHKSDWRIFSVIVSTDPFISYMAPDFYARKGGQEFNVKNTGTSDIITTFGQTTKNLEFSDPTERAAEYMDHTLNVSSILEYLERTRPHKDPHMLLANLMAKIRRFIMHSHLAMYHRLPKQRLGFNWFGSDFLMDDDLNPHFLESNSGPDMFHPVVPDTFRYDISYHTASLLEQILDQGNQPIKDLHDDWLFPVLDFSKEDPTMGELGPECWQQFVKYRE